MDVFGKCHTAQTGTGAGTGETGAIGVVPGVLPHPAAAQERSGPTEIVCGGRRILMACSGDHLALSADPRLLAAATATVGRPDDDVQELHERLEGELAAFLGHEAAMLTVSGYQADLALAPLFGPKDVVLADRYVHPPFADAIRPGGARLLRFRHNDMAHLDRLLAETGGDAGRLIVTEGLFRTGDLCELPGIAKLAHRHGARVLLDGGHDIGLLGDNGGGAAEHYGARKSVDLRTLTFSKCLGTIGGAVAGPRDVIGYLRRHAPSTVSLPAADTAAALAALGIIRSEPERRRRVLATAEQLGAELDALGFTTTARSRTPAIPVHVGDTPLCRRLWTELFNEGVFTNALTPPSVPEGQALIRVGVTAAHTQLQVERIVEAFASAGRRLKLIEAGPRPAQTT